MKRIIINGRFLSQRITGVQRYALEIIKELDKIAPAGEIEIVMPSTVTCVPELKNISIKYLGKTHGHIWEQTEFALYVLRKKGVSVNLCNTAPLLCPGIVCVHDVKIRAKPAYFNKTFLIWNRILLRNISKRAQAIITVSEFSKSEICRYYKVDRSRIRVIPSAWDHFNNIDFNEGTLERYGLKKGNYYFSLSSLEPNKNLKWIAGVAKRNPRQIFAVAGSVTRDVFSNGLKFECPSNMYLLGYVSDSEAKTIMRDCKAFLFPTFYEGFGLPPMEAMSVGARAVVSDTICMREIYEDSVYFINPNNSNVDMERLLKTSVTDPTNTLNKYSWKKSARKWLCVLNCVLSQSD